jgi:hypothetical protein
MPCSDASSSALTRGEHAIGTHKRVDGEQPQVWRRVDDYVLVATQQGLERVLEEPLAPHLTDQAHLDAGEFTSGRDHAKPVHVGDDCGPLRPPARRARRRG